MKRTSLNLMIGVLLSGVTYANAVYSQGILSKKISLQADDMSLKLVLNQIRSKAAVKFVYSSSQIALDRKVTAKANEEELGKVLNRLLGKDIDYVVSNEGFIILKDNHDGASVKPFAANDMAALRPVADTIIKGKILGETGEPFPGATIVEKGSSNGVASGVDGSFTLKVKQGATLV
ncbi:MAG TPA: hypothetical protein VIM87_17475, partial [Chitinophaga sp.]